MSPQHPHHPPPIAGACLQRSRDRSCTRGGMYEYRWCESEACRGPGTKKSRVSVHGTEHLRTPSWAHGGLGSSSHPYSCCISAEQPSMWCTPQQGRWTAAPAESVNVQGSTCSRRRSRTPQPAMGFPDPNRKFAAQTSTPTASLTQRPTSACCGPPRSGVVVSDGGQGLPLQAPGLLAVAVLTAGLGGREGGVGSVS